MHPHRSPAALLLLLAAAAVTLAGCDREPQVSAEQAQEAFLVAFGSAYVGTMAHQLGQTLPGVSLAEDGTVAFDAFDVTDLDTDYRTVSGTLSPGSESATADLVLDGGPVTTIAFDLTADQLAADSVFRATAVINGVEMEIEIDASSAGS